MFQFNIALYLTILLFVIGCDCTRLSENLSVNPNQNTEKPVIALLHGLGSNISCFNMLKDRLEAYFSDVDVVALTSVESKSGDVVPASVGLSINEQANSSLEELLAKVTNLPNRPIILIGHSQGGLRAYKMFAAYKNDLNVKGIITIATPWEGAPILNVDPELFRSKLADLSVEDDIERLKRGTNCDVKGKLNDTLKLFEDGSRSGLRCFGIEDLKPGSKFLVEVKNTLSSATVPILAIGGAGSNFNVFLPQVGNDHFKAIHNAWTYFVVDTRDDDHDMVVPLYSQLARNILPEEHKNFKRFPISDAIHNEILELPPNKKYKNILAHPRMLKKVEEFVREILYDEFHPKSKQSKKTRSPRVKKG